MPNLVSGWDLDRRSTAFDLDRVELYELMHVYSYYIAAMGERWFWFSMIGVERGAGGSRWFFVGRFEPDEAAARHARVTGQPATDYLQARPVQVYQVLDRHGVPLDAMPPEITAAGLAAAERAPDHEGSATRVLRRLGFGGHYPGKLDALHAQKIIRLERVNVPGKKRPVCRVWVLDLSQLPPRRP